MRILALIDTLTTPTTTIGQKCFKALSGALICYTVSGTLSTTVIGGIFSSVINFDDPEFSHSPRARLINAVSFAGITALVDHFLPIHRAFSYTICVIAFYATNQETIGQIPLIAAASIGLTYTPSLIEKLFRYIFDRIDIPSIANKTTDGVGGLLNQVFTNWTNLALTVSMMGEVIALGAIGGFMGFVSIAPSLGFVQLHLILGFSKEIAIASLVTAVSFVATYHLYGPHDIYAHYNLLDKVAATAAIIVSALFIIGHRQNEEQRQREQPPLLQRN